MTNASSLPEPRSSRVDEDNDFEVERGTPPPYHHRKKRARRVRGPYRKTLAARQLQQLLLEATAAAKDTAPAPRTPVPAPVLTPTPPSAPTPSLSEIRSKLAAVRNTHDSVEVRRRFDDASRQVVSTHGDLTRLSKSTLKMLGW